MHGDGLLWVDATTTTDDQVRLESTALSGNGRATLALVVEPIEIPLGFFSDEDLVVESVLLVDGFNSEEAPYANGTIGDEITVDPRSRFLHVDNANDILFYEGEFYRFYGVDGDTYYYDHSVHLKTLAVDPAYDQYDIEADDCVDDGKLELGVMEDGDSGDDDFEDEEYQGVLAYFGSVPEPEALAPETGGACVGPTTGDGGLLGSNGDVRFTTPTGEVVTVYGDVVPGPNGSVSGLGDAAITGDTAPRSDVVELPEVSVPSMFMAPGVRHDGLLPMQVPPGESGHQRIEVAADSELVLRGPATVVIGSLVLEPGALLTLDTRDGDVTLYVTEGLDLQPGSEVTTSSDQPDETSIQVGPIASGAGGAPVKPDAAAEFHGTVYAPETEVYVGGDFEVYGGIVARRLSLGAGARLHFDNAEQEGDALPRLVAWKIVELPAAVRAWGDPFVQLGVQPDDLERLASAHDLASVHLSIEYRSVVGSTLSFDGQEDAFDWSSVAEVLRVDRAPERDREEDLEDGEDEQEEAPAEEPATPGARPDVLDALQNLSGLALRDFLQSKTPLSEAELLAMIQSDVMKLGGDSHAGYQQDVLHACTPLPANVLHEMLKDASNLRPINRRDLLLASTPLPASVLAMVTDAPASVLTDSQKNDILRAH